MSGRDANQLAAPCRELDADGTHICTRPSGHDGLHDFTVSLQVGQNPTPAVPDGPTLVAEYANAKGRYVVPSARVHALAKYASELQEAALDVVDWSAQSTPYESERFADAMTRLRAALEEGGRT